MRHRQWTRYRPGHVGKVVIPPDTPWEDVGEGQCTLCDDVRRLYQSHAVPEVKACAPCTQIYVLSSISNHERPLPPL
jgi:hypothetical protein